MLPGASLRYSVHVGFALMLSPTLLCQLRESLRNKDWTSYEIALADSNKLPALQKLPECLTEIECARWQLDVQKLREKLVNIIGRKCIVNISTSTADWRSISDGAATDEQTIVAVNQFISANSKSSSSKVSVSLNDLLHVTQQVVKLRKLMASKTVASAKAIVEDLKSSFGLLAFGVFDTIMLEMNQCSKLIEAQECEMELDEALAACPTCAEDMYFVSPDVIDTIIDNSSKLLAFRIKKCESIGDVSTALMQKLAGAKHLLRGREVISIRTTKECLERDWSTLLSEYKKSALSSGITYQLANCRSEYNAIVRELERRTLFWDFANIICSVVVSGSVGRIVVDKNSPLGPDFGNESFKRISAQFIQMQVNLDAKVLANLNVLRQYCADILKVRQLLDAGSFGEADSLCSQVVALLADENGDAFKLKSILAAGTQHNEELNLCVTESKYQLALANLKTAVCKLDYRSAGDTGGIDVRSVSVDGLKRCHFALSKFSSANTELQNLLKLSSLLMASLSPLSKVSDLNEIHTEEMVECLHLYDEIFLDSAALKALIACIQIEQYMSQLVDVLASAANASNSQITSERNYQLAKLVMKMSDPSCMVPNVEQFIKIVRLYSALESGAAGDDWLYVEEVAENLLSQLVHLSTCGITDAKAKTLLETEASRRCLQARKAGTQAHLDVIMSAGPMKTSSGGLAVAVPSHSVTIIDSFLKGFKNDRKQYKELDTMFGEVEALLGVRQKGLQLLSSGWQAASGTSTDELPPAPARDLRKSVAPSTFATTTKSPVSSEETNMVTGAVYFCSLIEKLEKQAVIEIVGWDTERRAPFIQHNIYNMQVETVRKITEVFPNAIDDSSLLKVLSTFHTVLGFRMGSSSILTSAGALNSPRSGKVTFSLASSSSRASIGVEVTVLDTSDPVVDDSMLQKVRHLLNITVLPGQCSQALSKQVIVLEKGAMVHQIKQLIKSGEDLLVSKTYSKDSFSALVSKLSNLGAATGGDASIDEESTVAIKCLSIASDLCLSSAMMLPDECAGGSNNMKAALRKASTTFRKAAVDWLDTLPVITPVIIGINSTDRIAVKPHPVLEISRDDLKHYAECIAYISVSGESAFEAFDAIILSCLSRFIDTLVSLVIDSYPKKTRFESNKGSDGRFSMHALCVLLDTIPVDFDELALSNMLQYSDELMHLLSDQAVSAIRISTSTSDLHSLKRAISTIQELLYSLTAKDGSCNVVAVQQRTYCLVKSETAIKLLEQARLLLQTPPYFMIVDLMSKYEDALSTVSDELKLFQCTLGVTKPGIAMSWYNPFTLTPWLDVAAAKAMRQEIIPLVR
jgi:mevalonate kinase